VNYTKPSRDDGRWEIGGLEAQSTGELEYVEIFKRRENKTIAPIMLMENPDIGDKDDIGPSAGDLSLIAAAPLMYESLRKILTMIPRADKIWSLANDAVKLVEEEAANLVAEAEEAYANVEE
jgi:hypothetical protein